MLGQDIRFGLRILTKSPGFTLIVVLALALGIGANTMVFAIYNGAVLKSLPYGNPRRVVVIRNRNLTERYQFNLSYPDYLTYRDELRSFSSIAANVNNAFVLSDDDNAAESLSGNRITPNTFSRIGQAPLLGRDFNPEYAKTGADPVLILSNTLWQQRYVSDPHILGRMLR